MAARNQAKYLKVVLIGKARYQRDRSAHYRGFLLATIHFCAIFT